MATTEADSNNNSIFIPKPTSDEQLRESFQLFCNDYSKYVDFPEIAAQQVTTINASTEDMLTQLDELNAVVDTVRMNTETTQTLVPPLLAQVKQLQTAFALIDSLEGFMSEMNKMVDDAESRVTAAEQQFSSTTSSLPSSFMKAFSFSAFQTKKPVKEEKQVSEEAAALPPAAPTSQPTSSTPDSLHIINTQQYLHTIKNDLAAKLQ